MRSIEVRQGYVKFWRLGTIEFGSQTRWASRAPRSRGMWAFPYPFYDNFFTYHKYMDIMPKRLKTEGVSWEEQEKWINTVGKRVLPVREFWYRGDLFSHFLPNGDIGSASDFISPDIDWSIMDANRLAQCIRSSGADSAYERVDGKPYKWQSSIDHMEVFIAPNMGDIRESAPGGKR